ncbi:hypothetical protein LCGC14_0996230 [marine sediment metagenome]|uniref:Large polyvalent protein associated domain-containing protein n=1 Tax=marine sediment metagenome TaxID=412755 RepID=A0A0F9RAK1_9ZZZZ
MSDRIEIDLSDLPSAPGVIPAAPRPSTLARTLKLDAESEATFQEWYAVQADALGLNADPDAPEQQYDYRAAWFAGEGPDKKGHWPSRFKMPDHPNRFVNGRDTMMEGAGEGELDLADLPDAPPRLGAPALRQAPRPGDWERFTRLFREAPEKTVARAQNAFAFAAAEGIPIGEAYRRHDEIAAAWGGQDMPTTPELVGGLMTFPIVAGLMSNPASTILGLATFQAMAEVESAVISWVKNERYQAFQNRGLVDLLPEDSAQLVDDVVELIDFVGKGLAAKGAFKKTPQVIEAVTKKIIVEHKLPRTFYVDPRELKRELQVGGVVGADEMTIIKEFGLSGAEYRRAVRDGLHVEIPAERVTIISDRPWWARVKKLFKLEPVQIREEIPAPPPRYTFGTGAAREGAPPEAPPARPRGAVSISELNEAATAPAGERPWRPSPAAERRPARPERGGPAAARPTPAPAGPVEPAVVPFDPLEELTPEMMERVNTLRGALDEEVFQAFTPLAREEAAWANSREELYETLSADLRANFDKALGSEGPGVAEMDELNGQLENLREETARIWGGEKPAEGMAPTPAPVAAEVVTTAEPVATMPPITAEVPTAEVPALPAVETVSSQDLYREYGEIEKTLYATGRTSADDLPLLARRQAVEDELVRRGVEDFKEFARGGAQGIPGEATDLEAIEEGAEKLSASELEWRAPVAHWRDRQVSEERWEAKFAERYRSTIENELAPEIAAAEPPLTMKAEETHYGTLTTTYSRAGSTWPEWASDRGWGKAHVVQALEKLLVGAKLGRRELDVASAAVEEARDRIILENTSGYLEDPAGQEAIENYVDALWAADSGEIDPAILDMLERKTDAAIKGTAEGELQAEVYAEYRDSPADRQAAEEVREQGRRHLDAIRRALNLPPKTADTKKVMRLVTGQTKIGGLVRERAALKASMRQAERAARKAAMEGRKAGVEREYERLKALESARRERKRTREQIMKLADRIMRPVASTVDFYYREAIEVFQAGLDPGFRMEKTLEQRRRTRSFLDSPKSVLKDMPLKLLRLLDKKALNEYTIEELETLAAEVDKLRALGRLKRQLALVEERREFEKTRNEIANNILAGQDYVFETEPVVASTRRVGPLRRGARVARAYSLRPSRIFDLIDGRKEFEGAAHRFFYDKVNDAEDFKLADIDVRLDKGKAKLKELGLTLADLVKTREIDGVKYTVDEMIDVYVGFLNPRKKLAIMFGNGIEELTGLRIIEALTKEEREIGQFVISEYEENYNRLRASHVELTNQELGYEENYTPMRRLDFSGKPMKAELADELLHRKNLKGGFVARGFTLSRQDVPAEYQKPIRLGAYSTWLEQVPKQEQFIHLAKPIKQLRKMISDEHIRDLVRRTHGDEFTEAVESYVNRVADPNVYRAFDAVENGMRMLRSHTAIAYLAYNMLTMGKQLPSLAFYLRDAGPLHLLASIARFTAAPFRSIEFVTSRDEQMKHRSLERELEELKRQDNALYLKIIKKVGRKGMVGIYAFDRVATTIGWLAVYNRNVNRVGEAAAGKMAQKATLRTQPAAASKDIAQLYATNEFLNALTQFTNQLNQIYNMSTYDMPSDFRRGRFYRAFLSTVGLVTSAIVIWMVSNRRVPEDSEDLKEAVSEQFINSIPIFGRAITAISSGFSASELPVFRIVGLAYRAATAKETAKKLRAALEGMAVFFGIPYIGLKRIVEAVGEGDPARLLGGKKEKGRKKFKSVRRVPR